uniref:Ovule protein n=1 Tax=Schistocephalus solidus TaxID=70667 RepID=A0A183T575_SCHSO
LCGSNATAAVGAYPTKIILSPNFPARASVMLRSDGTEESTSHPLPRLLCLYHHYRLRPMCCGPLGNAEKETWAYNRLQNTVSWPRRRPKHGTASLVLISFRNLVGQRKNEPIIRYIMQG